MKAFIIVGHGDFPSALKSSAEMIMGKMNNLFAIPLEQEDGKESYKNKIQNVVNKLADEYESFTIFSDLLGGTPNNCVTELYQENTNIKIISGVNLPIVLTALTGDLPGEQLVMEGRNAISPINFELNELPQINETTSKSRQKSTGEPQIIKAVRVDARGIHGQVATAWIPSLGIDRVIIIDNQAVKDETQKSALKLAKPNNVKLSILNSKKAIERLSDPYSYSGEKILVILLNISTIESLSNEGYHFDEVILGNVPNRENTEKIANTVYLLEEEKEILTDTMKEGTTVYTQTVPNEKKYKVSNFS